MVKFLQVFESLYYLSEIFRIFDFEKWQIPYFEETRKDDYIPDDSATAIVENNQLIDVKRYFYSGICYIIEHVIKTTAIDK